MFDSLYFELIIIFIQMETPGKYILAIFSSPSLGVGKGERDINEFKQKEEFLEGGGEL